MDHKTTNVDEILKERGATYGSSYRDWEQIGRAHV